jgi:hypothetical protein
VDEDPATQWGAGASPVQWIEVDLQGTFTVMEIRLLAAQWPEGVTHHRLQVRASASGEFQTVHEFMGSTRDGDWLVFKPDSALQNVGQIRIQTVSSPSWVAWKEIQVKGETAQP